MFSISDIKEEAYPATYRKGKDIFETGGVLEMAYDIYMEQELPMAEISAKVRGRSRILFNVDLTVIRRSLQISPAANAAARRFIITRGCASTVWLRCLPM